MVFPMHHKMHLTTFASIVDAPDFISVAKDNTPTYSQSSPVHPARQHRMKDETRLDRQNTSRDITRLLQGLFSHR